MSGETQTAKRPRPEENIFGESAKRGRGDDPEEGPLPLIWQTTLDVFEILLEKGYPCRLVVLIGPFGYMQNLMKRRVELLIEGKETARTNIEAAYEAPHNKFLGFRITHCGPNAYKYYHDMHHWMVGDLHVVSDGVGWADLTYHHSGDVSIKKDGDDIVADVRSLPAWDASIDLTLSKGFKY